MSTTAPFKLTPEQEQLLQQIPAIIAVKNVRNGKSYQSWLNQRSADLLGYQHPEQLIDINDENLDCASAVNADLFYQHDCQVLAGKELQTLDLYPYNGDDIVGLSACKGPLRNQAGEIMGALVAGQIIKRSQIKYLNLDTFNDYFGDPFACTYLIGNSLCKEHHLTTRESECLFLLLRGRSAKQIAALLGISFRTVEKYINNLKNKMGVNSKAALIDFAFNAGLLYFIPDTLFNSKQTLIISD